MPQPEAIEWRVAAGAQIDSDSHGLVDVAAAGGPWSASLYTDTVQLRWAPEHVSGRHWVALQAEAAAAGLVISPWTNGAPDPSRALVGSTAGVEGGSLRYGPHGLYGGASLALTQWVFGRKSAATTSMPPSDRAIGVADALGGWWRPWTDGWLRAGLDGQLGQVEAHAHLTARLHPDWRVAPLVECRAGAATDVDEVTATRLGGLVPHVVPVAGAAWAEWWVEDYAAIRVGPRVNAGPWHFGAVADAARFDADHAEGFGLIAAYDRAPWSADAHVGWAPWIERAEGVSRGSVYVRVERRFRSAPTQ